MNNLEKINVSAVIRGRKSNNPIVVEKLSAMTGVSDRVCKKYVQELRQEGLPIAGDEDGYFWAENPAELDHVINIIKAHIHSRQETIRSLERTRLAMLHDKQMSRLL